MLSIEAIDEVAQRLNLGVVAVTAAREVVYANPVMAALLHAGDPKDLVGLQAHDLMPEDVRSMVDAALPAARGGDARAVMMVLQRRDGTAFPALFLPVWLAEEELEVAICVPLSAVETARAVTAGPPSDLRERLQKLALELQSLGLFGGGEVPLPIDHPKLRELTPRERETLVHLVDGERVPRIAERLGISPHTVRGYLKSLFAKLQVTSQGELIAKVRSLR